MDWPTSIMSLYPLPLLILLIGVCATPFIGLLSRRFKTSKPLEAYSLLVLAAALCSFLPFYGQVQEALDKHQKLVFPLSSLLPSSSSSFHVDMLGFFMAFSANLLGFMVCLYSVKYMERENRLLEYYTLLVFMIGGITGVSLAGDFFTLFIFWELMCISSYVLVAFHKQNWGPIEAGIKYLIMSAIGGGFLLFSMSYLYGMTGTLNFSQLSSSLLNQGSNIWFNVVLVFLIVGFGVKSAIVPLHTWLPDAHPEAPSPISAMLSGIVIETGIYGLCRLLYTIFNPSFFRLPVAALALITMIIGNVMALLQPDIKRLLAYSSISQIGYMLIGLSAGTAYGLLGLFLHVFNHSLMKGLAFLASGSLVHNTGNRDIASLRGIGRAMPFTAFSLSISLLGLGGVPSTNGFISKFILFGSVLEPATGLWWLAVAGVLSSAFSMAYYLRVMKNLFSEPSGEEAEQVHKEAPSMMVFVTTLMAALVIAFGLYPLPLLSLAEEASSALI